MPAVTTSPADATLRAQLSNLQGLLMLSMLMTESGDESRILHLAATSVPSYGWYTVRVRSPCSAWPAIQHGRDRTSMASVSVTRPRYKGRPMPAGPAGRIRKVACRITS